MLPHILIVLFLHQNVVRITLIRKLHSHYRALVLRSVRHIIGIIQIQHLVFVLICAGFVDNDGSIVLMLPILCNATIVAGAQYERILLVRAGTLSSASNIQLIRKLFCIFV